MRSPAPSRGGARSPPRRGSEPAPRRRSRPNHADARDPDRDPDPDPFPFGAGAFARFALHRARALVYRGKGDVAQFARDARTSAAYAPEVRTPKRLKEALTLPALEPAASASESPAVSGA